jgi:hypothetical protein
MIFRAAVAARSAEVVLTFSPGRVVMTPRGVGVHQNPSHAGSSNMLGITFVSSLTVLLTAP